jgi:hypothetical protein
VWLSGRNCANASLVNVKHLIAPVRRLPECLSWNLKERRHTSLLTPLAVTEVVAECFRTERPSNGFRNRDISSPFQHFDSFEKMVQTRFSSLPADVAKKVSTCFKGRRYSTACPSTSWKIVGFYQEEFVWLY